MFKNKMFLYGLGFGLVIAVLLLQLTYVRSGAEERLVAAELEQDMQKVTDLTEATVTSWAKMNQFRLVAEHEELFTQIQLAEAVKQARNEAELEIQKLKEQSHIRGLVIPSGATSKQVAHLLQEMDLIEDAKVFEDTMSIRGLSTKIKPGYFEFVGSPTVDELIEIIVSM